MNRITSYDLTDDFLRGRLDSALSVLNYFQLSSSDHIPLNPTRLTERDMMQITSRLPQYPYIVAKWNGVVNANGLSVVVNFDEDNVTDRTKNAKRLLQKKTYDFIYARSDWNTIEQSVVELLAREGSAIIRLTKEGKPVVDSRFRYNIYWNELEKKARYAYKDTNTGVEVEGLKNLYHGEEIYVIKHPSYMAYPVPLSPVDTILIIARLDFHALVANQKKFDNGMIGQIFLKFVKEILPEIKESLDSAHGKDDKKGWFTQIMKSINDKFSGSGKANQVSFVPGLDDIIEVGKDNREMQFYEIVKEFTPERVAWNWLLTPADFGTGDTSTYNNVLTFSDALYDKLGRSVERQLSQCLNEWYLPSQGIRTTSNFYVQYNQPKDIQRVEEIKSALEEWKANAITQNEYRAERGLDPIEGGDRFLSELLDSAPIPQERNNVIDAIVQPHRYRNDGGGGFFGQAREYRATSVDKALASDEYEGKKGFLAKLTKAINKQIKEYSDRLRKMENVPDTADIKPLETFYSFPAMKKDLQKFAGQALELVQKDKRTSFSLRQFDFDGEYPQSVLDALDVQVERILKGDKEFKSVDAETASQIETIIKNNISLGVRGIATLIVEQVEGLAFNRAELIAQTEVAHTVEETREIMYKSDPLFEEGGKKWLTSADEKVRPEHVKNGEQGIIPIGDLFQNGFSRAGTEPRCRCDVVYYTKEEL